MKNLRACLVAGNLGAELSQIFLWRNHLIRENIELLLLLYIVEINLVHLCCPWHSYTMPSLKARHNLGANNPTLL